MFNFFANLALSIYSGQWVSYNNTTYCTKFIEYMKKVPIFGIFNNSTEAFYDTSTNFALDNIPSLAYTIAVILSTICCIGCFFMIVKAVKKLFNVFLGE